MSRLMMKKIFIEVELFSLSQAGYCPVEEYEKWFREV
jgi:hypothetical protein